MADRVLRDLVLLSPADRRNGDHAVLLHLAAVAEPVPGPPGPDAAWGLLKPVTGDAASHAFIAAAVFGDARLAMAQLVGQCLLRLRGAGDKNGKGYDPPLVAAVDEHGRPLPPDRGAGRRGYHGYLVLPVFIEPGAGSRSAAPGKQPDVLDDDVDQSWVVGSTTHKPPLDRHSGVVESTNGKERRREEPAEDARNTEGKQRPEQTVPVLRPSLRSGLRTGTGSRARRRATADPAAASARQRGLKPYPEFKAGGGTAEGEPEWRRHLSFQIANNAFSIAGSVLGDGSGLAKGGPVRKALFHPWRLAVLRLLDQEPHAGWREIAAALTVHLIAEGPGHGPGTPDDPQLHGRADLLHDARRRLGDDLPPAVASAVADVLTRTASALDNWREKNPALPPIEAGQPDNPPF